MLTIGVVPLIHKEKRSTVPLESRVPRQGKAFQQHRSLPACTSDHPLQSENGTPVHWAVVPSFASETRVPKVPPLHIGCWGRRKWDGGGEGWGSRQLLQRADYKGGWRCELASILLDVECGGWLLKRRSGCEWSEGCISESVGLAGNSLEELFHLPICQPHPGKED